MSDPLARDILNGDRRTIARALTLVESGGDGGHRLLEELWAETGSARRIGITGPPGVGKSTLVNQLASRLAGQGQRVGVLAIDPSSVFHGGALLGDRIRMGESAGNENIFIRSLSSRGRLGGLSEATESAADILDAAGFDTILVETVGVGQSEVEVAFQTDTVVVVLAPGAGDGIQAMKSGLIEVAHIICVNKADLPDAALVVRDVEEAMGLSARGEQQAVVVTSCATADDGTDDLMGALDELKSNALGVSRVQGARRRLMRRGQSRLRDQLERVLDSMPEMVEEVAARKTSLHGATERMLAELANEETSNE